MDPTAKARAVIDGAYKSLAAPGELEALTAGELIDAAQAAARSRPTPQAPMVSAGYRADANIIRGPSGELGAISAGAEFGSAIYTQFGGRHSRGSWLWPTLTRPPAPVINAANAWLDRILS